MPKWVDQSVMVNGIDHITNNCNKMHVLSQYAQGDSAGSVLGNSVGKIAMVSGDFTEEVLGTYGKRLAVAAKTITANASTGLTPDLHIALVDTTGPTILAVTDEVSDQPITSGNPVDVPEWGIRINQPA